MGWLKRLCRLLGSAHASFFLSHLIYFSSLSLSSPPPLAAGSLAVACFSLNLSEHKLVCSDTGSKSTMAGLKLSNRMESFFWFWLLDIASHCGVRSWLGSEDWVKYHRERSVPWCSWNTQLLLLKYGVVGGRSCVLASFQPLWCYCHSYPTRSAFAVSIGGGYLTSLADMNNCHCCVVGFTLFVSNENPTLSDQLK